MSRWRVEMLGRLRARSQGGRTVERFRTQRCALLLAYLAFRPQVAYAREAVAECLWPDAPPHLQRARLRNELANLRRAFDGEEIIQRIGNDRLRLSPAVSSDAHLFDRMRGAAFCETVPAMRIWLLREAAALYGGDLLPGFYEGWLDEPRERLRSAYRETLTTLVEELTALERTAEADYWRGRVRAAFGDDFDSPPAIPQRPGFRRTAPVPKMDVPEPAGCFSGSGNLIVVCYDTGALRVLSPRGAMLAEVRSPEVAAPWGAARDASGSLYVTCRATGAIWQFGPNGEDRGPFAHLPTGSEPFGIAVDHEGCLLIAAGWTSRIHRIGPQGEDRGIFAETGVYHPRALVVAPNGHVFVCNSFRSVVCRYAPDGTYLGLFAHEDLALPHGMAVDREGHLYVSNVGLGTVHRFSPDGANLGVFATPGVCGPAYLAFDGAGNLYVACAHPGVIRVYSPDGADLGVFASDLPNPAGLLFNS